MIIRKVKDSAIDCSLIYNLSNDPLVRANSFNSKPIVYENHVKWFNEVINDSNILFFIVFENEDFVGQIRYARENDNSCVVSLSIEQTYRGKHIALDFLKLGNNELKKNWSDIQLIVAEVKINNIASSKLFISANFFETERNSEKIIYKYKF